MSFKEARVAKLATLREIMDPALTAPDPELDVSREMVKAELQTDSEFRDLSDWIQGGCIDPMYDERTVIPKRLREEVKKTLHSPHQGVLSMGLRAEDSVFWQNILTDLEEIRAVTVSHLPQDST